MSKILDDYYNLLQFNQELLRIDLSPSRGQSFLGQVLSLLDETLGYNITMMSSLSNSGVKEISANLEGHNVDFADIQKFLTAYWQNVTELPLTEDIIIFSRLENYKKTALYNDFLKPEGYKDLAVHFISAPGQQRYLSYIVYLSQNSLFTDRDADNFRLLGTGVALAHLNNIHIWDLRNRVNMLVDNMNYYPLGIMHIAHANKVVHVNAVAQKYLAALGITDSRLYGTFYVNKIYPHYMHNMRSRQPGLPVSVGDFLFNVVPAGRGDFCPAQEVFDEAINGAMNQEELLTSINDISAYVYIISRGEHQLRFSSAYLQNLGLTRREQEIVEMIVQGRNNKEAADMLDISENTVKTHLANIYKKLGINYRTELMDLLYKANNL